jgi:subtilisin family serine protease
MRRGSVLLVLALLACENPECPKTESESSTSGPFTPQQKVVLDKVAGLGTLTTSMAQGTKLTVVVDHQCRENNGRVTTLSNEFEKESGIRSHTWVVSNTISVEDLKARAAEDPCVIGIGPSQKIIPFSVDPDLSKQEHLQTVKSLKAAPLFFNSQSGIREDVVIAIIDTGVDLAHEDLKENIWVNPKEVAGNGRDDDNNGFVDDVNGYNFASRKSNAGPEAGEYHGTHVAGLAAARSENGQGGAGVMGQHLKIMSLNVFGDSGGAETADLDNAIRYAANNGAHVINMSLGGRGAASSTEAALSYAISKGVTIIVAAGNENRKLDSSYFLTPASYGAKFAGMLAVGSIDTRTETRSDFSNYSPISVEIAAPGSVSSPDDIGLYSTVLNDRYMRLQGTSMASPVAAGAAALAVGLVKSRGGKVTPALIEQLLIESGREIRALLNVFKGRVVDVEKLYQVIDQRYPAATPAPTAKPSPVPTSDPTPGGSPSPTPEPPICPV